jgi:hypothetical protein
MKRVIKEEMSLGFTEGNEGVLWYKGMFCVPNVKELEDKILCEAHESTYSIHPEGNKMYHDNKATYCWYGMKRDIVEYVALCNTCQRVETEHRRPTGTLQPSQVPEWNWGRDCDGFCHGIA